jgi:hypothetical protein
MKKHAASQTRKSKKQGAQQAVPPQILSSRALALYKKPLGYETKNQRFSIFFALGRASGASDHLCAGQIRAFGGAICGK